MTRVLVALLVYNGRTFVPRAIESLERMVSGSSNDVDVIVFDDASPEPGWSAELEAICQRHLVDYYRSPRNLGIPRNMNLGLLRAEAAGYDHVILCNSDVVVPVNLADSMVAVADADPRIASVTAWSNNASIFSIPNEDGERWLTDVGAVDQVSATLAAEFADEPLDIPVGMGFCLSVRVAAIREVGLMDPVFGRGYCEEVDWCRRALALGWRNVLARNTYVFHMGSATTLLAGLLAPGERTVQVNESIIDQRHPRYRDETATWVSTGEMATNVRRALDRLVCEQARTHGYVLEATWLRRRPATGYSPDLVRVTVNPDGPGGSDALVEASCRGWRTQVPIGSDGIVAGVSRFLGVEPSEIRILDHGSVASAIAAAAGSLGVKVVTAARYPSRVA